MGQIADDIISGKICALCCIPFISKEAFINNKIKTGVIKLYEHGHPAVCSRCYDKKCGYQRQDKNCRTL